MAKAYDYLENDAMRYGAGVPVGTKFRTLTDEQRQGFDDYMKRKIRNNPSAYADDVRAQKYLKDYDQGTFDAMRQQEIRDGVNPGGIWDDFAMGENGGAFVGYNPDTSEETSERERAREDLRNDDEDEGDRPEETPGDSDTEPSKEAGDQESPSSENPAETPTETPAEAPAVEGPQPAPGLGESGAATDAAAGGAEALAGAAESGAAAAEAGAAVAAGAETGAAVATGAAATSEIWAPTLIGMVAFFIVLSLLTALSGANPDKASAVTTDSISYTPPADVAKYCSRDYGFYSTSQAKTLFGSTESDVSAQIVSVNFPVTGGKIKVHKLAAPCFEAVGKEIIASSINYPMQNGGTFDWRPNVNNPGVLSMHSFGIAIDINPAQNPNGSGRPGNCTTNIPTEIVKIFNKYGFSWGGQWNSVCDAMHFEWHGLPKPYGGLR